MVFKTFKFTSLLYVAAAAILFSSCNKENGILPEEQVRTEEPDAESTYTGNEVPGSANRKVDFSSVSAAKSVNASKILSLAGSDIFKSEDGKVVFYSSAMLVRAEGHPRAYHPDRDLGLDHLYNAGEEGNWWSLVTDNGKLDGKPIVQGKDDPASGYYISTTALIDNNYKRTDPKRYAHSGKIPYIVLPSSLLAKSGVKVGDLGVAINKKNGAVSFAIVGNVGSDNYLGQGSIRLAENIGLDNRPKIGGTENKDIVYAAFPGSGNGASKSIEAIEAGGSTLLEKTGGAEALLKTLSGDALPKQPSMDISKVKITSSAGLPVYKKEASEKPFFFQGKFLVDADGSPRAYHKDDSKALDNLYMAGYEGNWWALATDNMKTDGKPLIQGPNDPAPGYYVSMTSLFDPSKPYSSPSRFVDAEKIPYMVLPPALKAETGAEVGDFAVVLNPNNGKMTYALFADVGPEGKLGEGSMYAARALGINDNPRTGGRQETDIIYLVFPESGNRRPRTLNEINTKGAELLQQWGGRELLMKMFNYQL